MGLALLFAFLVLLTIALGVFFKVAPERSPGALVANGPFWLLLVLIVILGWAQFGALIHE